MSDQPLIDARPDHLEIVQAILRRHVPERKVWAFGSRVTWTAKTYSDLDLVILGDEPLDLGVLASLKEEFSESDLPWKVDVVDWASASESFREIIRKNKVEFPLGEEWRKTKWGEEISLEYGKAIRGYRNAIAPYRVFGTNGPVGWAEAPLAPGPGIILGRKGAYRGVHFSHEPFFVIDTAYYVKPKSEELDMRWLYYAIIYHKLGEIDDGSPIPSTTRAAVYVRDLDVPSPPEQKAISSTLASLDDKIDLNRQVNETLEAMARAIFKDWFVDFGPTRAKMEGREPYLAQEIWGLFPEKMDDEGKPEGWEVAEIGKETTVVGGSTPSTKEPLFWGGGINWATPKDLSALKSPVLFETNRTVTAAGLKKISSGLLPAGTVLLSSRAPIGYIAISAIPVAVNQGFIALRCDGRLSNIYVWRWLHENMEAIKGNANGSTFQEISKKNFRPLPVIVPSKEVILAFNNISVPLYECIEKNNFESHTLAQTRDLLLPKLMSGEIRVANAEKIRRGGT
ncbi:MAG: restriction endonuclease subunit S [Rhodospirillales bacterium]|nr:restriction endonuclease subunit S [Rhodospirillales bacterium]